MRKTEHAITGEEDINEHIDKVEEDVKAAKEGPNATSSVEDATATTDAWGVEKAREANKHDASKSHYTRPRSLFTCTWHL